MPSKLGRKDKKAFEKICSGLSDDIFDESNKFKKEVESFNKRKQKIKDNEWELIVLLKILIIEMI